MPALQNFRDGQTPAISAAWLNAVDNLVTGVFDQATTAAEAQTALYTGSPLGIGSGGTGAADPADALANLGGVTGPEAAAASIAAITQSIVGLKLYPVVAAEGATVVNPWYAYGNVMRYGADATGTVASDNAFNAAQSYCISNGSGMAWVPAGLYLINGTITVASGVVFAGTTRSSEYYTASPYDTIPNTLIWKPALIQGVAPAAGPIFKMLGSSALGNLYCRHDLTGGATTGVIQIGSAAASVSDSTNNVGLSNVYVYGPPSIASTSVPDPTSAGIYFLDGSVANTTQRYGCHLTDVYISLCFAGIRLGENCNQNRITGYTARQCYQPIYLNGGAGAACDENIFTSMSLFNIGALPTYATYVFTLVSGANFNSFSGYSTECLGNAFFIDTGGTLTCFHNSFMGSENEVLDTGANQTFVPAGNYHSRWAQPRNRSGYDAILVPNIATPYNYGQGLGERLRFTQPITGLMPQLLNNAGTLVAGDVSAKKIILFGAANYTKAQRPSLSCKLKVFLNAPASLGESFAEVEFLYIPTNNTSAAGLLCVLSEVVKPASAPWITGLYFLTGVTSGGGFGIAVVAGNGTATPAQHIIVDLDFAVFTHDTAAATLANYEGVSFVSGLVTANDVTDSISLLSVADTAV